MHVHLRDPGQTYKTDIAEGTRIAAANGIADIVMMPNTAPPIDNAAMVTRLRERIAHIGATCSRPRAAECRPYANVHIIAAVTVGQRGQELTDFAALKQAGVVALSDDGIPVSDVIMEAAMREAQAVGLPLIDHCEPEIEQVSRDCELAAKTGVPIHIAHVSRANALAFIRQAKRDGLPVTCEVAPHHFTFTKDAVATFGGNARMAPPLATQADIEAVLEALQDGTIDSIATDHAPHHWVEKMRNKPPNGIIGLETLWPATLTALYFTGLLTLEQIVDKLCHAPRRILGLPSTDETVQIDLDAEYTYQPSGRCVNTPFTGMKLRGKVTYE